MHVQTERAALTGSVAMYDALLSVAVEDLQWWMEDELGEIFQHQLDSPLALDLSWSVVEDSVIGSEIEECRGTFRDLLFSPEPSLILLRRVKEFAKLSDSRPNNPMPVPIAVVLYYAANVAADIGCGARISGLSEQEYRSGIVWSLGRSWIDPRTRNLFLEGVAKLDSGTRPPTDA